MYMCYARPKQTNQPFELDWLRDIPFLWKGFQLIRPHRFNSETLGGYHQRVMLCQKMEQTERISLS